MSLVQSTGCLQCFLGKQLDTARALGTEAQAMVFARRLMKAMADAPEEIPMPCFGPMVTELLQELYGVDPDRFREEKIRSNQFVLERMELLREKAFCAPDPVLAGLQLAILGNYIDFVALNNQVDFHKLDDMIAQALQMKLDPDVLNQLREDLASAGTLLYLTDNAGEIGFDRIFAEVLAKTYPALQITFCVRGGIAANDATRLDAEAVGIPFPVIDSGSCIAGTYLPHCSEECRRAVEESDVVISKGMANVETLWGCGHHIYYAFLVKCPRFGEQFQKEMFSPVLAKEP